MKFPLHTHTSAANLLGLTLLKFRRLLEGGANAKIHQVDLKVKRTKICESEIVRYKKNINDHNLLVEFKNKQFAIILKSMPLECKKDIEEGRDELVLHFNKSIK